MAGLLLQLGRTVRRAALAAMVIAAAVHSLHLAADVASIRDDVSAFADYLMLRATAAPAVV